MTNEEMMANQKKEKTITPEERKETEVLFQNILDEMGKRFTPDYDLLRKAYLFGLEAHGNARRKDGSLYFFHPLAVAATLADSGFESDLICAALLHDTIEDCKVTVEELTEKFGPMIANIVDAVSKVSDQFSRDYNNTKEDLDVMSDVKFLLETETKNNRKAFYIKLADRLHNLRTISVMSPEQQKEKAAHTRNILIPVAERMHIYTLVNQLESYCLLIENPAHYHAIKEGYKKMLYMNRNVLEGENGLKHLMEKVLIQEGSGHVVSLEFCERFEDSIYRHLVKKVENMNEFESYINRKNIPLYNINLVVSDDYEGTAESVFFESYLKLNTSRFRITITGTDKTMGSKVQYYKMEDRYGNSYRLFLQKESELLAYSYGVSVDLDGNEENVLRGHIPYYLDEAAPDNPLKETIRVYKDDGSLMILPKGATVLDMAFRLHEKLGLCAKFAYINNKKNVEVPLYTRLQSGDMVHIEADYKKNEGKFEPHATIRWVEYVYTKSALKTLSRWIERNLDNAVRKMMVKDENGVSREVEMACTALDFCIATEETKVSRVKAVYVNKCRDALPLNTVLKYGDKVRFEYAENETAEFSWIKNVKTRQGREFLISYFEKKYSA